MPDLSGIPLSSYSPSALQVREAEVVKQTTQQGKMDLQKLDKAATEFEAILLGQWLNQAEHSFSSVPGGEDEHEDPGHDQWQSLGMQELAKSIAKAGGLGIAKMIRQHYSRVATESQDAATAPEQMKELPRPGGIAARKTMRGDVDSGQ
jgi:Rod binding domain-containing protein